MGMDYGDYDDEKLDEDEQIDDSDGLKFEFDDDESDDGPGADDDSDDCDL